MCVRVCVCDNTSITISMSENIATDIDSQLFQLITNNYMYEWIAKSLTLISLSPHNSMPNQGSDLLS